MRVTHSRPVIVRISILTPIQLWLLHSSSTFFPLAHFSSNRRGVAANEGHHGAPAMDSSYLLDDPAGPMDLDDSPCRGYTAASPERDERLSEVRGWGATGQWAEPASLMHTGAHTWTYSMYIRMYVCT